MIASETLRVDAAVFRRGREDLERALRARAPEPQFDGLREYAAEHGQFPPMFAHYWRLTGGLFDPPCTQAEFVAFVGDAAEGTVPGASRRGIEARLKRTYPSAVRQHHMELMLRERFRRVVACRDLDLNGLDFLVLEQGLACGLGITLDTAGARQWEVPKARRNPAVINVPIKLLRLDLNAAQRIGRFDLHSPADVDRFEAWMADQRKDWLGGRRAAGEVS